jgi:uncharacterized protein DUF4407
LTEQYEENAAGGTGQPPAWATETVPSRDLPRRIRVLTGVHEPSLDRMPTERARYTALACVMVGTALLGGISMLFALTELAGSFEIWTVPLALFWSAFVLAVDRWLVSGMAGPGLRSRLPIAVVRLLVAAVIGFMIAEPLVLQIFRTAVEAQVRSERQQHLDQLQAALLACNPGGAGTVPASPPPGFSCADLRLPVDVSATTERQEINQLSDDESAAQAKIDNVNNKLTQLSTVVREECNGSSGPGLTGHPGNGPACQYDEQTYQNFRNANPIGPLTSEVQQDAQKITDDQAKLTADANNANAQTTAAIKHRLAQETQVNAPIGLVERFDALSHLMAASGVIAAATWLLRLFFVLVDCLPVLVKLTSGATAYDRFVADELACAAELHRQQLWARRTAGERQVTVELDEVSAELEKRRQAVDFAIRKNAAELEADELDAIEEDYQRRLRAAGLNADGTVDGLGAPEPLNGSTFHFQRAS